MLKIGLMGCGAVANYGHLPAIARTPGLTLHAVFDPDPRRREDAKAAHGAAHAFGDADAFFDSGLDAVVVTSPAPVHRANVEAAAARRLPVLCEKPLAMTEADSLAMVEAMEAAGVPLFVGFTYRFAGPAMEIHRLLREGAIGDPFSLRLIYNWDCHGSCHRQGEQAGEVNTRRALRMEEGGPIVDCGVHQIDLARWWLGSEVVHQQAVGVWGDAFEAPDHVYLHLDHAAPAAAHTLVEMSYSYGHNAREQRCHFLYEIIGTDGLIRYDRENRRFELANREGTTPLPFGEEKNFAGMYEAFERALRTGDPGPMPTGRDGLIATRIARGAVDELVRRRAAKAG